MSDTDLAPPSNAFCEINERNRTVGHQLSYVTSPHGMIFTYCVTWEKIHLMLRWCSLHKAVVCK